MSIASVPNSYFRRFNVALIKIIEKEDTVITSSNFPILDPYLSHLPLKRSNKNQNPLH